MDHIFFGQMFAENCIRMKEIRLRRGWQYRIQRPGGVGRGRKVKSMWLPLMTIFFMTYFYRSEWEGHGPIGTSLSVHKFG